MALTLTKVAGPFAIGDRWQTIYTVAFDNSYATGGYSLKASDLGMSKSADSGGDDHLHLEFDNVRGYGVEYLYSTNKLKLFSSANTEVTNATDLSAITDARVVCVSRYRG